MRFIAPALLLAGCNAFPLDTSSGDDTEDTETGCSADWDDGCPCGMSPASNATGLVNDLSLQGSSQFAVFEPTQTFGDRKGACLDSDGTAGAFTFLVGGTAYGTLHISAPAAGDYSLGDADTDAIVELFGASPAVTFDDSTWSWGNLTVTTIGQPLEISVAGTALSDGNSLSFQATIQAYP